MSGCQRHRKLGACAGVKLEHDASAMEDRTIDGTNATLSAARRGQAPQPRSGAPEAPGWTPARPAEGHWSTPSVASSTDTARQVECRLCSYGRVSAAELMARRRRLLCARR